MGLDSGTVLAARFKRNIILNSEIAIELFVGLSVSHIALLVHWTRACHVQVVTVVIEAASEGCYLMLFWDRPLAQGRPQALVKLLAIICNPEDTVENEGKAKKAQ
jgi:hypothetical protein